MYIRTECLQTSALSVPVPHPRHVVPLKSWVNIQVPILSPHRLVHLLINSVYLKKKLKKNISYIRVLNVEVYFRMLVFLFVQLGWKEYTHMQRLKSLSQNVFLQKNCVQNISTWIHVYFSCTSDRQINWSDRLHLFVIFQVIVVITFTFSSIFNCCTELGIPRV